jgi:ADP-ribose pyrophosphatase YjhB (NUDIX family)/predicted transcriptional regulator
MELHFIQNEILKKLLFADKLKYSELRPENLENNKLNFHLNQLQDLGLIEKSDSKYYLTLKGKEFAGRLNTDVLKIEKQAKLSVLVAPVRKAGDELEFLIYTRLKQPFYGCQGFLSGKIGYGETIIEGAKREMKEECNLDGEPQIIQLMHYRVFDKLSPQEGAVSQPRLLEDKFMFLCVVKEPVGELLQSNEGKFQWVKESEFAKYITNHFESYDVFINEVNLIKNFNGAVSIVEVDHASGKF